MLLGIPEDARICIEMSGDVLRCLNTQEDKDTRRQEEILRREGQLFARNFFRLNILLS